MVVSGQPTRPQRIPTPSACCALLLAFFPLAARASPQLLARGAAAAVDKYEREVAAAAPELAARWLKPDPSVHGADLPVPLLYQLQNNDKSFLPTQICIIIGSYLITIVFIFICLLTFGRRLRRQAQYGSGTMELEMVKSPAKLADPSPLSPASTSRSWYKRAFHKDRKSTHSTGTISAPGTPGVRGQQSFNEIMMANEREAQQRELAVLYQAVMEHHDRKKESLTNITAVEEFPEEDFADSNDVPFSPISPQFPQSPLTPRAPPPQQLPAQMTTKPADKRILRIATGRSDPVPSDLKSPLSPYSPANPLSPRSPVGAIYPPGYAGPQSPTSPVHPRRLPPNAHAGLPASPRSFVSSASTSRTASVASANTMASANHRASANQKPESKTRKALRNLHISGPMQIPHGDDIEDRTPLSPRYYPEPGPAPQPPTPHTGKSFASVTTTRTFITQDSDDEEEYERLRRGEARDAVQPLPHPAPQRGGRHNYYVPPQGSDPSLPFRNQHHGAHANIPPTPVKTTYVESRPKGVGAVRAPRTAGMTPLTTTVPMTPYSPYMPFTPITPVTPGLATKREIKSMKKEERRRVLARDDGDLVQDSKDLWGEEY